MLTPRPRARRASLLEQQRPNVFSMDVANIMPGEAIAVELHYSELLVPEEGMYQFVYPTVVGPRYSTIPEAGADDHHQWLRNPFLTGGQAPTSTFDIQVSIAGGLPIQQVACPSHATDVAWAGPSQAHITLASGESHGGNRDFILDYRLSGDRIHSGLLLYEGETENFFMLMVQPPVRVVPEAMPPREYIFVLDVSGSMHGFPLDTAKLLMKDLLDGLRPRGSLQCDPVRRCGAAFCPPLHCGRFGPGTGCRPIHRQPSRRLGAPNWPGALETGLALPHDEGIARTMVVVTDGYIAAEKPVFGLIADQVGQLQPICLRHRQQCQPSSDRGAVPCRPG